MEYSFTLSAVVANPVKKVWSGAGILAAVTLAQVNSLTTRRSGAGLRWFRAASQS